MNFNNSTIVGIVFLIVAGYLYNKNNSNFKPIGVVGFILVIVGVGFDFNVKIKLDNYNEKFEELQNFLNFGATLPTLSGAQCLEGTSRATLQTSVQNAITDLTSKSSSYTSAWNALPASERTTARTTEYNNLNSRVSGILSNSAATTTDIRWDGRIACIDLCTRNNTSTVQATYSAGGICNCPAEFFPQVDTNNFVTCSAIDYTTQVNTYNTTKTSVESAISGYNTSLSTVNLQLRCNGAICPASAPLVSERTPTPRPI
jgi:hypothetical protein